MTARVYVVSGDELIRITQDDMSDITVTDPNCAVVLNPDRPEPIAIMLFDERYRVAWCESCGWGRWEWDGTRFKCPCRKRSTLTKEPTKEPESR